MSLLLVFIILNIINVIIQTIKSLCTINGGKTVAAIVNAAAYGFYTIVVVYMMSDLPLFTKAFIVGACNLVGVYIVKLVEEKRRKDKLWKVEMTVNNEFIGKVAQELAAFNISNNRITLKEWAVFNCYCPTQEESRFCREVGKKYFAKFFVSESKSIE